MSDIICLSYWLTDSTPVYGHGIGFRRTRERSMAKGDTSNSESWSMPNHIGTHVDLPYHFSQKGMALNDYPPAFWDCGVVSVVAMDDVLPAQSVGAEALDFSTVSSESEIILLKTGFGSLRGEADYELCGPVFEPELADALRVHCPRLRFFGFDCISLSSYSNREKGRIAHRAFLDRIDPILPIEDMDLSCISGRTKLKSVRIAPLPVSGADGTPCYIVGEVDE